MIPASHPYWLIKDIAKKNIGKVIFFHLSYYRYVPQTISDNRKTITLSTDQILEDKFIDKIFTDIPEGYELAFHSLVDTGIGDRGHLPLIDTFVEGGATASKITSFLKKEFDQEFTWYKSGRSYHGYGSKIVSQKEWTQLMGRLLLANQVNAPPIVDPRWIGHRLIGGYSALRWSRTTDHYKQLPTLVKKAYPDISS